mgnify:CR=1 FL=1
MNDLLGNAIRYAQRGSCVVVCIAPDAAEQVRAFTGSVTEVATLMTRLGAQPLKRTPLEAGRERVLARLPAEEIARVAVFRGLNRAVVYALVEKRG